MSSQDALGDRYGSVAPWRRRLVVDAVAVLVLAFAGWLGWTIWEQARPLVASGELTFTVDDDNTATATFRVDLRDDQVEATCTIKAYAEDHTLVGQVAFTPALSADDMVEQQISTDRRATSLELAGCTAPGQNRPR